MLQPLFVVVLVLMMLCCLSSVVANATCHMPHATFQLNEIIQEQEPLGSTQQLSKLLHYTFNPFQFKMVLRQIANRILPNFEKDLSRNLSKEVATMEELNFMAGRVYSYQTKPSSQSVFGSTSIRQAPAGTKLVRVEKPLPSKVGLFFD